MLHVQESELSFAILCRDFALDAVQLDSILCFPEHLASLQAMKPLGSASPDQNRMSLILILGMNLSLTPKLLCDLPVAARAAPWRSQGKLIT